MHRLMYMMTVGFVFFLSHLEAFYCISYKRETDVPISEFSVFGERCSGTNYLHSLILKNYGITHSQIGHKHFSPWLTLPQNQYLGDSRHYTFNNSDSCLFLIIFRDPYDWVRSLNLHPWHAHTSLCRIPFSEFIRSKWVLNNLTETTIFKKINPLLDMNPETGDSFANVLQLRSAKIKNMLLIQEKVNNCYCINYEILRDSPEAVLKEITSIFELNQNSIYVPIIYRKGKENQGVYIPKIYEAISQLDLHFINSQLDPDLEASIGYQLIFVR